MFLIFLKSADEYIPTPIAAKQSITTIDGNIEIQETSATTIGTNRIKINITKNVQLNKNAINNSENSDNNLAISNNDKLLATISAINENSSKKNQNDVNETSASPSSSTTEPEYVLKDSMKNTVFKRQPVVKSGLETSGLCSIM